jgi:ACR3 family arsenite transporter
MSELSLSEPSAETNPLGLFGRYLSLWVGLSIVGGVALGALFPQAFALVAQPSLPG